MMLGARILREEAEPLSKTNMKEVKVLKEGLVATMNKYKGVSLSAPQVGHPLRMFVMEEIPDDEVDTEESDGSRKKYPVSCVVNPKIINQSDEEVPGWESCLSIPGLSALIERPVSVDVEYTDENGKVVKRALGGDTARLFLHEFDHLEGLSMLEAVDDNRLIVNTSMVDDFEESCDDIFGDEDEGEMELEEEEEGESDGTKRKLSIDDDSVVDVKSVEKGDGVKRGKKMK